MRMNTRFFPLLLLVFEATLRTARSEQDVIYKGIGERVVLKPPTSPTSATDAIQNILWLHNSNLAVEWDESTTEEYSFFKGRCNLNRTTGELTIENLTGNHSGVYEVEINGMRQSGSIPLKVISPVPKPHVTASCNEERTQCILTCEANVTAMDPKPTYTWKFNSSVLKRPDNTFEIRPETSAYDFICEIENPVSHESSEAIGDPFTQRQGDTPGTGGLKINTGLMVFACLLAIVVGVVLAHRVKSGMWFYQKDSMPWEADFWRKTVRQTPSEPQHANNDAAEENNMLESNS